MSPEASDEKCGMSTGAVTLSATMLFWSVSFFLYGLHRVRQHQDYGWLDCGVALFAFVLSVHRLVRFEIGARRMK